MSNLSNGNQNNKTEPTNRLINTTEKFINFRNIFKLLNKPLHPLSERDIKNVKQLTRTETIYDYWESNDEGDTLTIYTGTDIDGVTNRYFLMHYEREWFGGWTSNDTEYWYEISKQEYDELYNFKAE